MLISIRIVGYFWGMLVAMNRNYGEGRVMTMLAADALFSLYQHQRSELNAAFVHYVITHSIVLH